MSVMLAVRSLQIVQVCLYALETRHGSAHYTVENKSICIHQHPLRTVMRAMLAKHGIQRQLVDPIMTCGLVDRRLRRLGHRAAQKFIVW